MMIRRIWLLTLLLPAVGGCMEFGQQTLKLDYGSRLTMAGREDEPSKPTMVRAQITRAPDVASALGQSLIRPVTMDLNVIGGPVPQHEHAKSLAITFLPDQIPAEFVARGKILTLRFTEAGKLIDIAEVTEFVQRAGVTTRIAEDLPDLPTTTEAEPLSAEEAREAILDFIDHSKEGRAAWIQQSRPFIVDHDADALPNDNALSWGPWSVDTRRRIAVLSCPLFSLNASVDQTDGKSRLKNVEVYRIIRSDKKLPEE